MWQCAHAVIGILIPLPAAGHRRHLHGGLGTVNIPVGILPGDGAAVGRIVGIPFGIGGAACFRFGPMS